MLTLKICDRNVSDNIEKDIFGDILSFGERTLLFEEDIPIGVSVFSLSDDGIIISRIGLLREYRGRRYGDFFTRSIIYKFLPYRMKIYIDGIYPYFYKLGFVDDGDRMVAESDDIIFPSTCKGDCK